MYYFSLNYEKLQFEIAHHQTHNFYVETYVLQNQILQKNFFYTTCLL